MSMINEFVEKLIEKIKFEIEANNANDDYTTGLRNGMRYCLSLIDGKEPEFESCKQGWIPVSEKLPEERDWYLAVFKEPYTGFIGLPYIADYLLGDHTPYTTKEGWIIKDCTDIKDSCEYFKELECVAWQPLPEPYKGE